MTDLVSTRPEFIEEFVKTAYAHGLDADTTAMMLRQSQTSEMYSRDPHFRDEFDYHMEKSALFRTLGRGVDWALGKGLRGLGGGLKAIKNNPWRAAGIGGAGLGAWGVHKGRQAMQESARTNDVRKLLAYEPSYLESGAGATGGGAPAGGGGAPGSSIFDYVNSINKAPTSASPGMGGAPSTSPATGGAPTGGGFGPRQSVDHLKSQLADLTMRESAATQAIQAGASTTDPRAAQQAQNAHEELRRLTAQKNSLKKQMTSILGNVQGDQTRMHQQAGTALGAADRLLPYYQQQQQENWRMSDPVERSSAPWYKRWFGPSEDEARGNAEEAGSMLNHIRQLRQRAQQNSGTTLL